MLRLVALVSIVFVSVSASRSKHNFDSSCEYKEDMCKVDLENCIRKMREKGQLVKSCYGLQYGSGMLYDDRKEIVKFHITIEEKERHRYPDKLTYTIVRKTAAQTNWSVPDSVSRIDNCCSMKENDTCTLPTKGPDDHLYAFFPLKQDKRYWYCQYRLQEELPKLKWCETDDKVGCAIYESGNVVVKKISEPLSFADMNGTLDYCYFSTAEKYLAPNGRNSFIAVNITAEISGDRILAQLSDGKTLSCDLRTGIRRDHAEDISKKYYEMSSDYVCYFIRTLSKLWISQPYCLNVKARMDFKRSGKDLVTITIISAVLACAAVLTGIVCLIRNMKNCFKKITFNMPGGLQQIVYNNVETKGPNETQPTEEIVNEMKFLAVNRDHSALEVGNGAPRVEETDGLLLNIEEEEATLLGHEGHESGGQSTPVSEFSEASYKTKNNSGIQSLNNTSGVAEHEEMMNNQCVDKDNLDREICKVTFPQYVMKDSLDWPGAPHPLQKDK